MLDFSVFDFDSVFVVESPIQYKFNNKPTTCVCKLSEPLSHFRLDTTTISASANVKLTKTLTDNLVNKKTAATVNGIAYDLMQLTANALGAFGELIHYQLKRRPRDVKLFFSLFCVAFCVIRNEFTIHKFIA